MPTPNEKKSNGEGGVPNSDIGRILIVRLSAMGDVIHTMPAVYALREAFPQARIGWLIEERWAELLCAPGTARRGRRSAQRPLVDWVHTVNLKSWRKSFTSVITLQKIATVWNDVRAAGYDVAVDLQGAVRSAVLANWSGVRTVYGPAEPRESPASMWYTRTAASRGAHVVQQNLAVAEAVAQRRLTMGRADFPYDLAAGERISASLLQGGVNHCAILSPGAGWGAKRWPAERFGEVAYSLKQQGVLPILNYGPGEEGMVRIAAQASNGAALTMSCSLSELIALTRRARLFIGGDTGPMHLAAAMGVPVVAIFGPTDPVRNGPFRSRSIVLRSPSSFTTYGRAAKTDEGLLEITPQAVFAAACELLKNSPNDGSVNG